MEEDMWWKGRIGAAGCAATAAAAAAAAVATAAESDDQTRTDGIKQCADPHRLRLVNGEFPRQSVEFGRQRLHLRQELCLACHRACLHALVQAGVQSRQCLGDGRGEGEPVTERS